MKFHRVASFFDRTPMWDAYTGQKLSAKCQITAWDTPRRDGMTTVRRTLYTSADSVFPQRRGVIVAGAYWIVGKDANPDTWGVHTNRVGYVIQHAEVAELLNTEQATTEQDGVFSLASKVWVKDIKDTTEASEAEGQFYLYFAVGEPVKVYDFVKFGEHLHIVRNTFVTAAGFLLAECNELDEDCHTEVELLTEGKYNPVTESYETEEPFEFKAILLNWSDDYIYKLPSHEKRQVGDKRLRVTANTAAKLNMNSRLKIQGEAWGILGIEPRPDGSTSLAIRRL